MSSGGGGSQNTVSTTKTELPEYLQPYATEVAGAASNLFRSGVGGQYAPFSTVVPYAPQTNTALQGLEGLGMGGAPLANDAYGAVGGLINGSGTPAAGLGNLRGYANGAGAQPFGSGPGQAGVDALSSFAGAGPNPYLDHMFDRGAERISNNVQGLAARLGRTGSFAEADHLGDNLADFGAQLYGSAYESDANRRMSAGSQLAGLGLAGADQRFNQSLGAATGLQNIYNSEANRTLSGIGQLPGLFGYQQQPYQTLLGVGGAYEDKAGQELADATSRWQFGQDRPWELLGRYSGSLGLGSTGMSSTTNSQVPGQQANPVLGGLGGALGGFQLGNALFPGVGGLVGAGLGGLAGAFL